jgi:hypothetical protein
MSGRQISRGTCAFCKNTYTKSGMSRHLTACKARKAAIAAEEAGGAPTSKLIRLAVDGTYASDYWLHLEVPADATLYDLDQFLRSIWLECCGHLSMFKIAEQNFLVQIFDDWWAEDDRDMNVRLGDVLTPALRFSYRYDFGSSTDLTLKVVSERMGVARRDEPIQILARNDPLDLRCDHCGKPAAWVDVFEDYTLLCRECDETDGDGEVLMPIVNSPRVGVCGYTGDAW